MCWHSWTRYRPERSVATLASAISMVLVLSVACDLGHALWAATLRGAGAAARRPAGGTCPSPFCGGGSSHGGIPAVSAALPSRAYSCPRLPPPSGAWRPGPAQQRCGRPAVNCRHARRLADVAGTRRYLRDPPQRVDTGIPARNRRSWTWSLWCWGRARQLPLIAWQRSPAGGVRGDRGLGRGAGRPRLSDGPAAGVQRRAAAAASRQPPTPWTWRTVTVVGLLLAYLGAAATARQASPQASCCTGLAWAVAWFAGERTRLRRASRLSAQRPCRARRAEAERVSGCWPPPQNAPVSPATSTTPPATRSA